MLLILPLSVYMIEKSDTNQIYIEPFMTSASKTSQSMKSPRNMLQDSDAIVVSDTNPDLKHCNIVIAHGGDPGAAFATQIYLYGINFFIYAQLNNMTLWIDYNNDYNSICSDPSMNDENVWNYYLEAVTPSSQNCNVNKSNFTVLKKGYIFPKIHYHEPWSIHAWYYNFYFSKSKQKRHEIEYDTYYQDWYFRQRKKGYDIVSKYFHYKSELIKQVNMIWLSLFGTDYKKYKILGVHMRGTDKASLTPLRRKVLPFEYAEYIIKFIKYYGEKYTKIFIATDDGKYLKDIKIHLKNVSIYSQNNILRSFNENGVFELNNNNNNYNFSKYEIGKQVMIDILLLSKCNWFIHSSSAVAEAVFYNNILLHNKSVHLEYFKNRQIPIWFT